MAGRVRDRSPDGPGDGDSPETGRSKRPDQGPGEDRGEPSERQKAETEIAAGDVADDLADFA